MCGGKIARIALGIALFVIGYVGLFPMSAVSVIANVYTVGLSADSVGWHLLGAVGGAAASGPCRRPSGARIEMRIS